VRGMFVGGNIGDGKVIAVITLGREIYKSDIGLMDLKLFAECGSITFL